MESLVIRVYLKPDPRFQDSAFPLLYSVLTSLQGSIEVSKIEDTLSSYFLVEFDSVKNIRSAVEYLRNQFFRFGTVKAYALNADISDSSNRSNKSMPQTRKIGGPVNLLNYVPQTSVSPKDNSRFSQPKEFTQVQNCILESQSKISLPSEKKQTKSKRKAHSDTWVKSHENVSKFQNIRNCNCEETQEESSFIQITNFNPKFLNHKVVVNLACCFGNAYRVYVDQPEGKAVILYQNANDAKRAKFHLSNQTFFGSLLQVLNSAPASIDLVTLLPSECNLKMFDCNAPDFRYKNTLYVKYNAPSAILHFTNLSENCTPQILFQIISAIHEPRKIIKLAKKSVNATNMMLVVFGSVTESLEVLTILHNKIVDHKSLRVSFSHTKLT